MVIQTDGPTPGQRYGHTMSFKNSLIILFGGNANNELKNDTWILDIGNVPFKWKKLDITATLPPERVYHSSALYNGVDANGVIVIFGGRGKDQNSRNDLWTLYSQPNSTWKWAMNTCGKDNAPPARFQHTGLFIDRAYVVIGGRNTSVGQDLPISIYDTKLKNWKHVSSLPRFRHST